MKKFFIYLLTFFFLANISYARTINFKCSVDEEYKGLTNQVKWYHLIKEKVYFIFENSRLKKIGSKKNDLRTIDWFASFEEAKDSDDFINIFGIFATNNFQIISYNIRYAKEYPDIASHFSNLYNLKPEAFEDWKQNNNPSYTTFENWINNYPNKMENLMRKDKFKYVLSALPEDMQNKQLEKAINSADLKAYNGYIRTSGSCKSF